MSLLSPFVGSNQSRYAAIAILLAIIAVSLAILFGANAMPLSQKFFFILIIFLLSIPGILLTLLQLTCLVTGAGNENKRWWCSLYSWIMSVFVILYSVLIVGVTIQTMMANRETFRESFRGNNSQFIKDYPGTYPFDAAVGAPAGGFVDPTVAYSEDGNPVSNKDGQYMLREQMKENFSNPCPSGQHLVNGRCK
jgi:hypothetical protein